MEFNTYQKIEILKAIMAGEKAKQLAFRFKCQPNDIYELRGKYLIQKWVLKKHPKKDFTLEVQDEL